MARYSLILDPVPPFRLDLTVWALRRRPDNIIDRWDGRTYRRVLAWGGRASEIAVSREAGSGRLVAEVHGVAPRPMVREALALLLGTAIDLAPFHSWAEASPMLGPLAERFRGFKPPRFPSLFEALCNAISCQQITLTLGIRLLGRLAESFGQAAGGAHSFPEPAAMAVLRPEDLRGLGFSTNKARAIIGAAEADLAGELDGLEELPDEAAVERLRRLRGVGPWTAEYVLLRGLGRTSVFPGEDVGVRNNLQKWMELPGRPDFSGVREIMAVWRPYGGLLYFHLLLDRLQEAGYF